MIKFGQLPFLALLFAGLACSAAGADEHDEANEDVSAQTQALAAGTWNGCRGTGTYVCTEFANDSYFSANPGCSANPTCAGKFYACNASCPMPTPSQTASAVTWGRYFRQGEEIFSNNRKYKLTWQTDSNLVVYRVSDGRAIWNSGTQRSGADELIYQTDGNLVMYRPGETRCTDALGRSCNPSSSATPCFCSTGPRRAVWHTRTNGAPDGSYLIMQDDGNLVMYSRTGGVLWSIR